MSALLLLRDFYRAGVRVSLEPTGFLIAPPDGATAALEDALRHTWREVKEWIEKLPAPGRCQICGAVTNGSTNWPDTGHINCVECAVVMAERMGLKPQIVGQLLSQRPRSEVEDVVDATGVDAASLGVMHEANLGATLVPALLPGGDRVGCKGDTYQVPKQHLITAGPASNSTGCPMQPRESQQEASARLAPGHPLPDNLRLGASDA